MRCAIARTQLVILFAAALVVSMANPAQADDHSCSLAGAAGIYGDSDSGTIIGIGPRSAVALLTLDDAGIIKGKVTASLNGTVTNTTLSGTYSVNPDCTGTTAFGEYDPSGNLVVTGTVALVWDADMREIRFLFTSAVLWPAGGGSPDGTALSLVINGVARKR